MRDECVCGFPLNGDYVRGAACKCYSILYFKIFTLIQRYIRFQRKFDCSLLSEKLNYSFVYVFGIFYLDCLDLFLIIRC